MVVSARDMEQGPVFSPTARMRDRACYIPPMLHVPVTLERMKRIGRTLLLASLPVLIAACAVPRYNDTTVRLLKPFDQDQALMLLRDGANTIAGTALLLHQYGGVTTCAGQQAVLIPATAHADERMAVLYGPSRQGVVWPPGPRFEPELLAYQAASRSMPCGSGGAFRFEHVADGSFYVVAIVPWTPRPGARRFASLAQRVEVSGGKLKTVELKGRP